MKLQQKGHGIWVEPKAGRKVSRLTVALMLLCVVCCCPLPFYSALPVLVVWIVRIGLLVGVFYSFHLLTELSRARSFFSDERERLVAEDLIARLEWDGAGKLFIVNDIGGHIRSEAEKAFEQVEFAENSVGYDAAVGHFGLYAEEASLEKKRLLMQALDGLRPGGAFAFVDLFCEESSFGSMERLLEELATRGIAAYAAPITEADYIPEIIGGTGVFDGIGILYGIKNAGV